MTQRSVGIAALVLVCVGCGEPKSLVVEQEDSGVPLQAEPCTADSECALGEACVKGRCGEPPPEDSGVFVCSKDEHCKTGEQCVRSTGECVLVKVEDAGVPDAGPP